MKFRLFSEREFDIDCPVALIECYCFQTDFYSSYDLLLTERRVEAVGKIGARIDREKLPQISVLVDAAGSLPVFHYEIDQFLKLDDEDIRSHVIAACSIVQSLMRLGLGLSQCSKVLHTVYPRIMPMIDSMLQEEYRRHIDSQWTPERPEQILLAYYMNLKAEPTANSLDCLFSTVSANVPCLTKVRVFDIVWWSYLRATRLSERHHITWKTV